MSIGLKHSVLSFLFQFEVTEWAQQDFHCWQNIPLHLSFSASLSLNVCDGNESLCNCPLHKHHLRASVGEEKGCLQIQGNISANNGWNSWSTPLGQSARLLI